MNIITRSLESLSPRDRNLLAGLIAFFSLAFVGILLWTLNGWLNSRAQTIADYKGKYELLVVMQQEYADAHQKVLDWELEAKKHTGKTPSSFLEETATKDGVREALTVSKQGTEDSTGGGKETRYKVVLKRVPLQDSVAFLYDLETSGYPMGIETADFKVHHVKGEKMITLTLETIHYEYETAGGG